MPLKDILEKIAARVPFNEWEAQVYGRTGYIRWQSIFHFYSLDCVKAGYLLKNNGIWSLTPEGEKAMKGGPEQLIQRANEAYKAWAKENRRPAKEEPEEEEEVITSEVNIELVESNARAGIVDFLKRKNPYEFQYIVAALLRSMGYHTPFIAERGPDGGMDIIAYLDPLGFKPPRVVVQVKHKPEATIPPGEIQSLIGALNKASDVGLFVTSGHFSKLARNVARTSSTHCELIDGSRFIELWTEHYERMPDEDKALLPLHAVWFLGPTE